MSCLIFPNVRAGSAICLVALAHPLLTMCGYLPFGFAMAALIRQFLIFTCLLYPVKRGLGNTSAVYLFFKVMVHECFACRMVIKGSLGSNILAKTSLFSCSDLDLLLRASFLGAFFKEPTQLFFSWCPRFSKSCFVSSSFLSLISGSEQILTILKPSDFEMALVVVFLMAAIKEQILISISWFSI